MSAPQRLTVSTRDIKISFIGKDVNDVPKPALVLDAAKVRRHCSSMLEAVAALGVGFRAHVKTHKTAEVARLQVGPGSAGANFIVSTMAELEFLLPVFKEVRDGGRKVNVLYGIPLPKAQLPRLAAAGRELGPGSIAVLVDHPAQLDPVGRFYDLAGHAAGVFLKVDTGYHRAGLPPSGLNKDGMLERVTKLEAEGRLTLIGLYSHSSLSYSDTTAKQAMDNLGTEIQGCLIALRHNQVYFPKGKILTISVGATPQVVSVENLTRAQDRTAADCENLRETIQTVTCDPASTDGLQIKLELHAGCYALLDMQQLSTNAREFLGNSDEEVAVSVVAEICSIYNKERQKPEALVAVGTLGLGREPCAYGGWGVVGRDSYPAEQGSSRRIVVDRISQEHAILSWESSPEQGDPPPLPLEYGKSVRIYPNHACITSAMYGYYLIVDSSLDASASKIVDVWFRASGW